MPPLGNIREVHAIMHCNTVKKRVLILPIGTWTEQQSIQPITGHKNMEYLLDIPLCCTFLGLTIRSCFTAEDTASRLSVCLPQF